MNGIGVSVTVVNAKILQEMIGKIKFYLKKKKKILILGCSGVGKTQFIRSINAKDKSNHNEKISREDRTKTSYRTKFLVNDSAVLLTDTPGEKLQDTLRKNEITELFKNQGEGIINIVSFGYHEGPIDNIKDVFDEDGEVKSEYIQERRRKEIEQLDMWINWMSLSEIKWVITLVSKADVWWDDNWNDVENYYKNSAYGEKISKLKENGIEHIILPYSSIIDPFYDIKGSAKFGEPKKNKLCEQFLRELLSLVGEEK